MSKKAKVTIIVSVLIVLIAAVLAYFLVIKGNEENTTGNTGKTEETIVDYETLYLDYINENAQYFSRGMMLCDLNDDNIPELFSIAYGEADDVVYYHEIKDGSVVAPAEGTVKTYIDIANLVSPATFFENSRFFLGIYKNKATGQKALINSVADGSENDRFDIITFKNDKLIIEDNGVKSSVDNSWPIDEQRDAVMADYEVVKEGLYASYLLRGEFGGENGSDPVEALKGLLAEFKNPETNAEYNKATDGDFFCYIKDINIANNEIALIPVANITYEEYTNAMDSDKIITVNGEDMSIQIDENLYNELGIASLFHMPWFEYRFNVPTEENSTSVIEGYRGNAPLKVKMSDDLKIRYGVTGYDAEGEPVGYETLGRNQEYTVSEYLAHFAQYNMGSYYKVTIKNNELVLLDVLYNE